MAKNNTEPRPLPDALGQKCAKYALAAKVLSVAIVAGACLCREPRILFFLLFSLYLLWEDLSLQREWGSGKIEEVQVYCSLVRPSTLRDQCTVSFCTDTTDEQAVYYQFTLPSKKAADTVIPGSPYRIYFRAAEPRTLIAFVPGFCAVSD